VDPTVTPHAVQQPPGYLPLELPFVLRSSGRSSFACHREAGYIAEAGVVVPPHRAGRHLGRRRMSIGRGLLLLARDLRNHLSLSQDPITLDAPMNRWKLYVYGGLAVLGTSATATYALAVAPKAKTPYELAVLVFAASAAGVGWLGVVVAWLTYRLEAGKVPRPDISIIDAGSLVKRLTVSIDLSEPPDDFSERLEAERQKLEATVPEASDQDKARRQVGGFGELIAGLTIRPSKEDIDRYRGEIANYLRELEQYLRESALYEAFWKRAGLIILAFTNHKAGAPAEGVHAVLRVRNDDGIRVLDPDDIPERPEAPAAPQPPRPRSAFGGFDFRLPDYSSFLNH